MQNSLLSGSRLSKIDCTAKLLSKTQVRACTFRYISSQGQTALHLYVDAHRGFYINRDVLDAFLAAGAKINATDNDGDTPLMMAKSSNIARMLIERGADPTIRNKWGKMAADVPRPQGRRGSWGQGSLQFN